MIGTQLLWMSLPFTDSVMIGQLGQEPLAALGICSTFYTFLLVTAIGLLSALNPMISQCFGAREFKKIPGIVQSGMVVALGYSFFIFLALFFAEDVLLLMGQDPRLVKIGSEYLKAISWGVPAQVLFIVFRQYADAIGFPKPVVIMIFIGALTNLVLDYVFIYGWGPIPAMGVAGPGHASSLVNWVLAIGLYFFTKHHHRFKDFGTWNGWKVSTPVIKESLILGTPLAGSMLMEVGYFCGSTWLAGLMGPLETAAHQIALTIASTTFMIPLGLSFAVSVQLGHYAGAGDIEGIRRVAKLGALNTFCIEIINATLLFILAPTIGALYTTDPATQELAAWLLRIAGVFQIFDGLQVLGMHALRGLKDTRIPFFFALFSYWVVGMSLSVTLAFKFKLGISGVWFGMVIALACAALLNLSRLRRLTLDLR